MKNVITQHRPGFISMLDFNPQDNGVDNKSAVRWDLTGHSPRTQLVNLKMVISRSLRISLYKCSLASAQPSPIMMVVTMVTGQKKRSLDISVSISSRTNQTFCFEI